jgi:predicted transcriptional regulator
MNVEIRSNDLERRRDRLYIMAEILEVTLEGALKTQVMYKANLSFAQLQQYLSLLLDLNLLELTENNKKSLYKTTIKGMRFLESYKQIQELLEKTNEINGSNGNGSKNGNHSVFLVNRGSHVICKGAP